MTCNIIPPHKLFVVCFASICISFFIRYANAENAIALVDSHIHYSHDAWEVYPPEEAVAILRKAGLKRAFVSSSSDEGTQMLRAVAPDLIVPVLRPYYRRGELATWMHDPGRVAHLKEKLETFQYYGIGEFHAFGEDILTDTLQGTIALAAEYDIFLHAHSDAEAIKHIFDIDPDARVLWAHSGFESVSTIDEMLSAYPNLWADLAFRSEHASRGEVNEEWLALFTKFPNRFLLGTDTYTPERWPYVVQHATWSRDWLQKLPKALAQNIAWKNAEGLLNSAGNRN